MNDGLPDKVVELLEECWRAETEAGRAAGAFFPPKFSFFEFRGGFYFSQLVPASNRGLDQLRRLLALHLLRIHCDPLNLKRVSCTCTKVSRGLSCNCSPERALAGYDSRVPGQLPAVRNLHCR